MQVENNMKLNSDLTPTDPSEDIIEKPCNHSLISKKLGQEEEKMQFAEPLNRKNNWTSNWRTGLRIGEIAQ